MNRLRAVLLLCILTLITTAVGHAQGGTPDPTPTQIADLLKNEALYFDMGVRLRYPAGWLPPQFSRGQLFLTAAPTVMANNLLQTPLIALRIIDPIRDFGLPKDAPLDQIAAAVTLPGAGSGLLMLNQGRSAVAGVESGFVEMSDQQSTLVGITHAFLLPDGRYGVLAGVSPAAQWPDFGLVFEAVRTRVELIRPAIYPAPTLSATLTDFSPGGIRFALPTGWTAWPAGNAAVIYRDPAHAEYHDNSGLANGPMLVIAASPMPEKTLQEALIGVVGDVGRQPVRQIQVAGEPAVTVANFDQTTWQLVSFVAFTAQGGRVLNVLRWSRPGMIAAVADQMFQRILNTVQRDAP